jgi:hypothetical protein
MNAGNFRSGPIRIVGNAAETCRGCPTPPGAIGTGAKARESCFQHIILGGTTFSPHYEL